MSSSDGSTPPEQVDQILASSSLVRAIENDRYKHLLDNVPVAVAVSRGSGSDQQIVYVNGAFEGLTGLTASDIEGGPWACLDNFKNEDDAAQTLGQAIPDGSDFLGVFRPIPNTERLLIVQAYASMIEGDDGAESFRIAALVDIAGRERAQLEQYESRIRERDTMMRELQHRVKNNLQLITALIRLEARSAGEGESVALARLASRIDALTVLYRALSAEDAGTGGEDLDLGKYLEDITQAVMIANAGADIEYETDIGFCRISINIAMPVGLLVNEMLTNALKYAFVGRTGGRVKVSCQCDDDRVKVVVSDDGVGISEGVVWPAPRKLGALVLQTLRENAKNVKFDVVSLSGSGTFFTLMFDRTTSKKPN
ncbi:MAG TPA: histidine kinase dimerization/phosphoacceptor domain -containing protein [Afipia sp.]